MLILTFTNALLHLKVVWLTFFSGWLEKIFWRMINLFHTIKIESDQGLSNSKNDILKVNQIHIKNKLNNMGLS